jgi:flavin reductase (DIM6/NTAB) family NADH-FMN oxidoreductase RutF
MRRMMASFPTGVAVITAMADGGTPWGMTCTSLCSVSLDPPTLLVCLRRGSPTLAAVQDGGAFAVNLLHDGARRVAELFGSGVRDRFDRVAWYADGTRGPHLVDAAHTIADCRLVHQAVVGTHTVIMGQVEKILQLRARRPLMYGLRHYAVWPTDADGNPADCDLWITLGC